MRNEWSMLALCACLLVPTAHAASTADELARLEAEHVLLKARLRMLETRAQIAARRADIDRLSSTSSDSGALPTVTGIDGIAGKLQATVMMDNGHLAEARAGNIGYCAANPAYRPPAPAKARPAAAAEAPAKPGQP